MNYRLSHQSLGKGLAYSRTYESGYYAAQWAKIERPLLQRVITPLAGQDKACLDFACGTGRITSVAAPLFGDVVGVDISSEMLAHARVPTNVKLIAADLTRTPLGRQFDVVLAFRFFLNAEPTLKQSALHALRRHMKDDGRLICNIHMSATSIMGRLYRLLEATTGRVHHSTLSHAAFRDLLSSNGFRIERTFWYGFLPRPGPLFPRLMEVLVEPGERLARSLHFPDAIAQSFMVVARKADA